MRQIPIRPTIGRAWVSRMLVAAQILVVLLLVRKWLFIPTYRLYLEDRIPIQAEGMAWQQFTIEDRQVVPQIITEGSARFSFAVSLDKPSTLWFGAKSGSPVSYEISIEKDLSRQVLTRGQLQRETSASISLPPVEGQMEFRSDGPIHWSDLRIVQSFDPIMPLSILAVLLSLTYLLNQTPKCSEASESRSIRFFFWAATAIPTGLALGVGEATLENLEERLPLPALPLRRELGIVSPDPRWHQSDRYGLRLRPHLNTFLEWRHGDIVQMTFIPPEISPGVVSRFPFRTDSEGFRNGRTRVKVHVAALGDSFTDALTLPEEKIWTTLLEQALGQAVQNYGTAGFGPQQELGVLEEYVLQHHPRVTVVAYFAGNDIFNAERTERSETLGEKIQQSLPGWKIKKAFARYETFYLFALASAAVDNLSKRSEALAAPLATSDVGDNLEATSSSRPTFDRGMFSIPVKQRMLRFALMPPYLQTLQFSRQALEGNAGWKATCATLVKMKAMCEQNGAQLVVMFIPFKSQVVLPLLYRSFNSDVVTKAFGFYFRQHPTDFDLKTMSNNRLAQNGMMRRFCEESKIPLLDLTPVFQAQMEAGRNLYFSDDSHWNAAGHEVAATELVKFMRERGLHK